MDISGATPINANDITVTPGGGSFTPVLTFSTQQMASASALEAIFTYQISGNSYTGSALSLSNSSETGDGGVTEIENFCAGGTFGPDGVSGCSGTAGSLLTLDGIQNSDQSGLGPSEFLSVTNDFTVDGGTYGTASGGTFSDSFTAAPEPMSGLLLLAGALCALLSVHKRDFLKSLNAIGRAR